MLLYIENNIENHITQIIHNIHIQKIKKITSKKLKNKKLRNKLLTHTLIKNIKKQFCN